MGINNEDTINENRNSNNAIVYSQMDETYEIFLRKYGLKRRTQALEILEACMFLLKINLNSNLYRKRRRNDEGNEFCTKVCMINENQILRYCCIILKEYDLVYNHKQTKSEDSLPITEKIALPIISLMM